ncbi:MAG: DUF169 domain-containing protein [Candidatus Jordarchaeales archaeon]|nr:DUF169 domain-containing protein [Candidatus Jordarchaeia archaeon]
MDYQALEERLNYFLRLRTYPVGVKLVRSEKGFPERVRRPSDLGMKLATCQGVSLARRNLWVVGFTADDIACIPSAILYGFLRVERAEDVKEAMKAMGYRETDEGYEELVSHLTPLITGENYGVYFAPLRRMKEDPDVLLVYCNSAQAMRLIHAANYKWGVVAGSFLGLAESCRAVVETLRGRKPGVFIPGAGDRAFAQTADDEIIFAIPYGMLEGVIDGLEKAGAKVGVRYPFPMIPQQPLPPPAWTILEGRVSKP